jgi:tRNA A22 N-methylase
MLANELLDVIRDAYLADYLVKNPASAATTAAEITQQFCDFAHSWLRTKGLVGVGQTIDGFAVRFADGSEHILAQNTPAEMQESAPVLITGMASRQQGVVADTTRSVPITGN